MKFKKTLLFFLPGVFFIVPALLGLSVDGYNRYLRGISTPFLIPSLGLLLIGLFFLAKKRWMLIPLILLSTSYIALVLVYGFKNRSEDLIVYYYRHWKLNTQTGRLKLISPLGKYPPSSGPYITCNFSLTSWKSYFDNQPVLCTAFDEQLRLLMFLNDHATEEGMLREFQMNYFIVERKSLLGEPLDRGTLRIAFVISQGGLWPRYKIKKIYEAFERQVEPGHLRVIESISRNAQGKLEGFTESSLLNLTSQDVYAVYDQDGVLAKIPRGALRSFAFPAKIDASRLKEKQLPAFIEPGGDHVENHH